MSERDRRILLVDDEPQILDILQGLLNENGYECVLAADAQEARARLREQAFGLVLSDVNMPGESGLKLIRHVLAEHPDTAAIMVTAVDDVKLATAALEIGAYGYIIKPFEQNELLIGVANALRRRHLEMEQGRRQDLLERRVAERTQILARAVSRLERAEERIRVSHEESLQLLTSAAEFRSDETGRHIHRMSRYCELLARKLGFDEERRERVRLASTMHDIGKIGISDRVLLKPGKLTVDEFEDVKRHAEIGYRLLSRASSDLLGTAAIIAWTHHEWMDWSGYPRKLAGEAIPLEGRLAAVADVFDALTSRRVYKSALPPDAAFGILREERGRHFDPALLDQFLGARDEVLDIMRRYADR
jgi:putative two-component system response regulator